MEKRNRFPPLGNVAASCVGSFLPLLLQLPEVEGTDPDRKLCLSQKALML